MAPNVPPITHFLYQAQYGECFHCQQKMDNFIAHSAGSNGFTKEHIIARSQGGPKGSHNYVLAHRHCNSDRGTRPFTEHELMRVMAIHGRVSDLVLRHRERTGQYRSGCHAPRHQREWQRLFIERRQCLI